VNGLQLQPVSLRIAALALGLIAFWRPVSLWLGDALLHAAAWLAVSDRRRRAAGYGLAIVAGSLCWLLREATQLYGDGQLQLRLVERSILQLGAPVGAFLELVRSESVAWGTNAGSYLLLRWLHQVFGVEPLAGWQLLQALCGAVLVLMLMIWLRRGRGPLLFRTLAAGTLLLSGAVQLCFGHIETYTPWLITGIAYLGLGLGMRATDSGRRTAAALGLVVLAIALHAQAALLLPSLAFRLLPRLPALRFRERSVALALAFLTLAGTVALAQCSPTRAFFLPLFGDAADPGAISGRHLGDIVNEILLVLPAIGLTIGLLAAVSPDRSEVLRRRAFAALVALPSLLFLLLFKPELGMARDWDLFVVPVLGAAMPLAALARERLAADPAQALLQRLAAPGMAVAALVVVPWIALHADESKSVFRFEALIAADSSRAGYAWENLALHHDAHGDDVAELAAWQQAWERSGNPRYLVTAGNAALALADTAFAVSAFDRCLEAHPGHELARRSLVPVLLNSRQYERLFVLCEEGRSERPGDPYYFFMTGLARFNLGQYDEAESLFLHSERLGPEPWMQDTMDRARAVRPLSRED
jgi:tetratricopeptide (TPR) repeat protein